MMEKEINHFAWEFALIWAVVFGYAGYSTIPLLNMAFFGIISGGILGWLVGFQLKIN